ncbi:MAG: hypothetical protein IJ083_16120 [Clostridia bacterium]|nr:hypothetical protein [Clostridia bacterium]
MKSIIKRKNLWLRAIICLAVCIVLLPLSSTAEVLVVSVGSEGTDAEASDSVEMWVRSGGSFALARDRDGVIWGWGDNVRGQLGDGTNKRVPYPAPVAVGIDGRHVADIQCGNENVLLLMDDGTVYTCGNNNYGQQGDGKTAVQVRVPQKVEGLEDIVQVACGYGHCLARTSDGRVYGWGRNSNGQIGTGDRKAYNRPVLLEMERMQDICCGGKFSLGLDEQGRVWGWGANEYGQLPGCKVGKNYPAPTLLQIEPSLVTITAGGSSGYGLDAEGNVYAWGRNDFYQTGTESRQKNVLEPVMPLTEPAVFLAAYNSHCLAIHSDGRVTFWGSSETGQMGNGVRKPKTLPIEAVTSGRPALQAAVSSLACYLVLDDGSVWATGYNKYMQIGLGSRRGEVVADWTDIGLNLKDCTYQQK